MEDDDIVECYGRHAGEVRKADEAELFQLGIERRVWNTLLPGLKHSDSLAIDRAEESRPDFAESQGDGATIIVGSLRTNILRDRMGEGINLLRR